MIKNTTVFLDFSGEVQAQNHITAYAEDLGSRILHLECSQLLKQNEHLIVTYHLGDTSVFSGEVEGLTALIPNAVMSKAGEYKAYFAVYDGAGIKLTASSCVDITVMPCKVLSELNDDEDAEALYASLVSDYDVLSVKSQILKDNLCQIADVTLGVNLFDSRLASDKRLDAQTGLTVLNSQYIFSDFISVSKGESLYASYEANGERANAPCTWAVYDENKQYITARENSHFCHINNESVKYARVCIHKDYSQKLQIAKGQYGYEEFGEAYELKQNSICSRHLAQSCVTNEKIADLSVFPRHISSDLAALIASAVVENQTGSLITSSCPITGGADITYRIFGLSLQSYAPTPTSPRIITDSVSPIMRISGKNLLDGNRTAKTHNGVTFTPLSNGGIKVEGTSAGGSEYELIAVPIYLPAATYAFSCNIVGSGVAYSRNGYSFTKDDVSYYSLSGALSSLKIVVGDGQTADAVVFPQLEADKITEFSPPKAATTVNFQRTLRGLEVGQFDGYTVKHGDNYYICDSIDSGSYIRRIGEVTLNGTDTGAKATDIVTLANGKTAAIVELSKKAKKLINSCGVLCSHFSCDTSKSNYCFITQDGNFAMVYEGSGLTDLTLWNNWLKSHAVAIRYVLQSYTSTDLHNTASAKTLFPDMSVVCSSGFAFVSFKADTKKYIDSHISEALGGITS